MAAAVRAAAVLVVCGAGGLTLQPGYFNVQARGGAGIPPPSDSELQLCRKLTAAVDR